MPSFSCLFLVSLFCLHEALKRDEPKLNVIPDYLCVALQAQHNTRMLQLYSQLDYRVKVIGYTMKVFAKVGLNISRSTTRRCSIQV